MVALDPLSGTTLFHTHRLDIRRKILENIFSISAMDRAWKSYVRPGLRDQEVFDLHDYNDFHWDRHALFANIRAEILAGRYTPRRSIPIRVEKKHGVTRTLVIPTPEDAVVLQCIVENLLPRVMAKQPSRNAFFSRSHGFAKPEISFGTDYIWFRRWAQFSRRRIEFSTKHKCICTTDIANYFDNIDYGHLRNMISALDGVDEVTMDILFMLLDSISWRPDYLPSPGRSLPQVNFDAPRLLSHLYLFEIDEFLKEKTANTFVRWVDDITVAVDDVVTAKEILRDLDQLLMTRGLRLNSGKTQVLTPSQSRRFFHQVENDYLTRESALARKYKDNPYRLGQLRKRLKLKFEKFVSSDAQGHADKVIKRYLTLISTLGETYAVGYCATALIVEPGMRDAIWRYFSVVGPTPRTFKILRDYLVGGHALDDSSIFHAAAVLVGWHVKPNTKLHKGIRELGIVLSSPTYVNKSVFHLLAGMWIVSKYGLKKHLSDVLLKNEDVWRTSEFLSRQVASLIPKFRGDATAKQIRLVLGRHQFPSSISVLSSLDNMVASGGKLTPDIRLYLLNGKNATSYSLQRFLLCLNVLMNKSLSAVNRATLREDILKYLRDPLYIHVLQAIKI